MGAPRYPTPLRGREDVLQGLLTCLDRPGLATLWGPGGVGKTRLGAEGAHRLRRQGRSVWFVSVPEGADPDVLTAAVLTGLEMPDAFAPTEPPVQRIQRWLDRHDGATVVLDEAEVALDAVRSLLAGLGSERWRVLVTSRVPLDVVGEQLFEVVPLAPGPAAELFRDAAPRGTFLEADDINRAVERLGGLALAVELAAARLEVVSMAALLQRLDYPLSTLRAPTRDGRHAAIWDSLDASWQDLPPWVQQGAGQLMVFAHDIALEAAEAVLDVPQPYCALDVLHVLARRCLLRQVDAGENAALCYRPAPFVRGFLSRAAGEDRAAEARHARWFGEQGLAVTHAMHRGEPHGGRLASHEPELAVAVQRVLAGRVASRAALARCGAALVYAMGGRRSIRARLQVVDSVLEALAGDALDGADDPAARVKLGEARGMLLARSGQTDASVTVLEEALALARATGNREAEPALLGSLGNRYGEQGREDDSRAMFAESLQRAVVSGNRRAECMALIAVTLFEDWQDAWRPDEGLERLGRAAQLAPADDDITRAVLDIRSGQLLNSLGRTSEAAACFERAFARASQVYNHWAIASAQLGLGEVALLEGRPDDAVPPLEAGLRAARDGRGFDVAAECGFGLWMGEMIRGRRDRAEPWPARVREELDGAPEHHDKHRAMAAVMAAVSAAAAGRSEEARAELGAARLDPDFGPYVGVHDFGAAAVALLDLQRAIEDGAPLDEDRVAAELARFEAVEPRYIVFLRVARLGLRVLSDEALRAGRAWVFQRDGTGFVTSEGEGVDCARHRSASRILAALVEARLGTAGSTVTTDALIACGWPGERLLERTARNRLHVALNQLRKLGLTPLQRVAGGYRLDPEVPIRGT